MGILLDVVRHLGLVPRCWDRLANGGVHGQNASPSRVHELLILQIVLLLRSLTDADLGTARGNLDLEEAGALEFGVVDGEPGVPPPIRHDAVGDELHGVELLLLVLHEGGVAEQDSGPVVVVMVEGAEGEDEAVDVRDGDADGQARRRALFATHIHHTRGDVAVEVEVQRVPEVGGRAVKGAHLADHGDDDGEGGARGVEGYVDELGGVDQAVDRLEGVVRFMV